MSVSVLEIVALDEGEIVLRRAGDDAEPLLRIQFSEESRCYLMDNTLEIARAMIQAGIEAASNVTAIRDAEGVEALSPEDIDAMDEGIDMDDEQMDQILEEMEEESRVLAIRDTAPRVLH
ncbi:MAG: hypothetical protein ACK5HY_08810 [Parahaliea sp.]